MLMPLLALWLLPPARPSFSSTSTSAHRQPDMISRSCSAALHPARPEPTITTSGLAGGIPPIATATSVVTLAMSGRHDDAFRGGAQRDVDRTQARI